MPIDASKNLLPSRRPRHAWHVAVQLLRTSGTIVATTLFWFVIVNGLAWLWLRRDVSEDDLKEVRTALGDVDPQVVDQMAEEFRLTATNAQHVGALEWGPYALWHSQPFSGKYIRINESGLRHTVLPVTPAASAPRIYLFGGSTAWGLGVPDDATIASSLAKLLYDAGFAVNVVNHAQLGYVSTQDMFAFERLCATSDVPSIAIFYGSSRISGECFAELSQR